MEESYHKKLLMPQKTSPTAKNSGRLSLSPSCNNEKMAPVPLLLATSNKMDGPYIPYAPADAFLGFNKPYMVYHSAQSGFSFISPIGAVLGAILPAVTKTRVTRIQSMALGSLIAGGAGCLLGLGLLAKKASDGENQKLPWNDEGIQQRIDGLSYNYHVRAVDVGSAAGAGAGLFARLAFIPPTALSGVQAMALGVVLGSVGANIHVALQKRSENDKMEEDDN
jgi:hypothetical protein